MKDKSFYIDYFEKVFLDTGEKKISFINNDDSIYLTIEKGNYSGIEREQLRQCYLFKVMMDNHPFYNGAKQRLSDIGELECLD